MGKRKCLGNFDKDLIVMARRLGQSIFKTSSLMACSWYTKVGTYQKYSTDGQPVN